MCSPAFEPITTVPGSNQESSSSISQFLQLWLYCRLLLHRLAGGGCGLIGGIVQNGAAAADVAGIYWACGEKHWKLSQHTKPKDTVVLACVFWVFYVSSHPSYSCKHTVVSPCFTTRNSAPQEQLGSGVNTYLPTGNDESQLQSEMQTIC